MSTICHFLFFFTSESNQSPMSRNEKASSFRRDVRSEYDQHRSSNHSRNSTDVSIVFYRHRFQLPRFPCTCTWRKSDESLEPASFCEEAINSKDGFNVIPPWLMPDILQKKNQLNMKFFNSGHCPKWRKGVSSSSILLSGQMGESNCWEMCSYLDKFLWESQVFQFSFGQGNSVSLNVEQLEGFLLSSLGTPF